MKKLILAGLGLLVAVAAIGALSLLAPSVLQGGLGSEIAASVTKEDNNTTVDVPIGKVLVVSLRGGGPIPFRWAVSGKAPAHLEQVGEVETRADSSGLVGAPATMLFRFRAVRAGEEPLLLVYQGIVAERQIAERFQVTVRTR